MPSIRVKALAWKQDSSNSWIAGPYSIHHYWPHNGGPFVVTAYFSNEGAVQLGKFSDLEAAKAAAQIHHDKRIRAEIEVIE